MYVLKVPLCTNRPVISDRSTTGLFYYTNRNVCVCVCVNTMLVTMDVFTIY